MDHTTGSPPRSFFKAIASSPLPQELAKHYRGDRATVAVREHPELLREFADGRLDPGSAGFLWCATQAGRSTHPDVFALMNARNQRAVRERAKRERAYRSAWAAAQYQSAGALERRSSISRHDAEAQRDDIRRQMRSMHQRLPCATHRPAGTARSREHRPGRRRQSSHVARSTSSSDPGPPPPPRRCACGCGRDISHKRSDARTFDASCRKRLERGEALRESWFALVGEIEDIEARIERLLVARHEAWRDAAQHGGHRFLTATLADQLQAAFATRASLLARYLHDATEAMPCPGHGQLAASPSGGVSCLKCGRGPTPGARRKAAAA